MATSYFEWKKAKLKSNSLVFINKKKKTLINITNKN